MDGILGQGTFGKVYRARDRAAGTVLAVKVIEKSKIGRRSSNMLAAEIANLCRVDHPNVVKLYRHYEDAESVYLVMDFCAGGDLERKILLAVRKGQPLEQDFVIHTLEQLVRALAHLHARGIAHLDVKAANIMLAPPNNSNFTPQFGRPGACRDGGGGAGAWPRVVLIDLGVGMLFRPGDFCSSRLVGTPATMAPEAWRGEHTPHADIWSAGVVFFGLCALELLPFKIPMSRGSRDNPEAIAEYWRGRPEPEWPRLRHMHASATELCQSMLRHDRRERITAQAALRSTFLRGRAAGAGAGGCAGDDRGSLALVREVASMLTAFRRRSILYKSIALSLARKGVASGQAAAHAQAQGAFRGLDRAGSGRLDVRDLAGSLEAAGLAAHEARETAEALDLNRDGEVDWTEFVAACTNLGDRAFERSLEQKFRDACATSAGGGYGGGGSTIALSRRGLAALLPGRSADEVLVTELFEELAASSRRRGGSGEGIDWQTFLAHLCAPAPGGGGRPAEGRAFAGVV